MKIEQLSLPLETSTNPLAKEQKTGQTFLHNHNLVMRIKPTGFLLNSTVIGDVLLRGDILVVNLEKGTMYPVQGVSEVEPVDATCKWRK